MIESDGFLISCKSLWIHDSSICEFGFTYRERAENPHRLQRIMSRDIIYSERLFLALQRPLVHLLGLDQLALRVIVGIMISSV